MFTSDSLLNSLPFLFGFFFLVIAFAVLIGFLVNFGFLFAAQLKSRLTSEEYSRLSKKVLAFVPSSIWLPVWVQINQSQEINVRWGTHFVHVTSGALNQLNPAELQFVLKSAKHLRKLQQKRHFWIYFLPMLVGQSILFSVILVNMQLMVSAFLIAIVTMTAIIVPINKWSLHTALKWYPEADLLALTEIPSHPAARTALQKTLGSLPDNSHPYYQNTLNRLNYLNEIFEGKSLVQ